MRRKNHYMPGTFLNYALQNTLKAQSKDWMIFVYLRRLLQSESATTFPYGNITLYIATFFATATVFATAAVYTVILRLWYVESELIWVSFKIGEVLHLIWLPSQTISTLKLVKNIQVRADGIAIVWVKKEYLKNVDQSFLFILKFLKCWKQN